MFCHLLVKRGSSGDHGQLESECLYVTNLPCHVETRVEWIDWLIVILLNGVIVAFGFYLARGVRSTTDWFLAGRSLPWWIVGLSMYATAIDASDIVADSGFTYEVGFSYFVANMVGTTVGWTLAAFLLFLPLYRAGMYTNAEYLEVRFGPTARVLCALVQVQYRTLVLAIMGGSLYWTVRTVCGWDAPTAMATVVGVAVFASVYTAFGGLKSVAITDVLQFAVMTVAALVVWVIVFNRVGGWAGVESKLAAHDPELPGLLHVGRDHEQTPSWLVILGFTILGLAYPVVNHTQSMRMLAAKSVWDFRMCAWIAGLALVVMSFFNLTMGVFGRALYPDPEVLKAGGATADRIYPLLVSELRITGVTGLIVAGIFAAALSTYDSIGSSISALLTRDVYARLIVRDRDDEHYLRVGQWLTPAIIGISFLYLPFLLRGTMTMFFLELTSAFVIPLLTLFLMGRFTRVHSASGSIGLLAGAVYGLIRQLKPQLLPDVMADAWAAYPFAILVSALTMLGVSLIKGWHPHGDHLTSSSEGDAGWLQSSQQAARELAKSTGAEERRSGSLIPVVLALGVIVLGCFLCFVVFW